MILPTCTFSLLDKSFKICKLYLKTIAHGECIIFIRYNHITNQHNTSRTSAMKYKTYHISCDILKLFIAQWGKQSYFHFNDLKKNKPQKPAITKNQMTQEQKNICENSFTYFLQQQIENIVYPQTCFTILVSLPEPQTSD